MKKLLITSAVITMMTMSGCNDELLLPDNSQPENSESSISVPTESDSDDVVTLGDLHSVSAKMAKRFELPATRSKDFTIDAISNEQGDPLIYVLNYGENGGWLLVSANKHTAPILAYSEEGNYHVNGDKPEALKQWERETILSIEYAAKLPVDSVKDAYYQWLYMGETKYDKNSESRSRFDGLTDEEYQRAQTVWQDQVMTWANQGCQILNVGEGLSSSEADQAIANVHSGIYPLYENFWDQFSCAVVGDSPGPVYQINNFVLAKWGQSGTYNSTFPNVPGSSSQAIAGCVNVAIGQVMRYFEYPNYDWVNMPYNIGNPIVSNFLYNIATSTYSNFQVGLTTTYFSNGYTYLLRKNYAANYDSHNINNVIESLNNRRPVISYGQAYNANVGHTWVVSGMHEQSWVYSYVVYTLTNRESVGSVYSQPLSSSYSYSYHFYCNWGWDGLYNGYFTDNSINPGNYNYSYERMDITDIHPRI